MNETKLYRLNISVDQQAYRILRGSQGLKQSSFSAWVREQMDKEVKKISKKTIVSQS